MFDVNDLRILMALILATGNLLSGVRILKGFRFDYLINLIAFVLIMWGLFTKLFIL